LENQKEKVSADTPKCKKCNKEINNQYYAISVYGFCPECNRLFIPLLQEVIKYFCSNTYTHYNGGLKK
jgi:hypothetical protein